MSHAHASGAPFSGALPATTAGKFYPILRSAPGAKIQGLSINPCIHGVWCHYLDRRTQPCLKSLGTCQPCDGAIGRRWYGYLPILLAVSGKIALAEITAEAALSSPLLSAGTTNLRGMLCCVERIGQSRRSRCRVSFVEWKSSWELPPPIDVARALMRIWGQYAKGEALPGTEKEGSTE